MLQQGSRRMVDISTYPVRAFEVHRGSQERGVLCRFRELHAAQRVQRRAIKPTGQFSLHLAASNRHSRSQRLCSGEPELRMQLGRGADHLVDVAVDVDPHCEALPPFGGGCVACQRHCAATSRAWLSPQMLTAYSAARRRTMPDARLGFTTPWPCPLGESKNDEARRGGRASVSLGDKRESAQFNHIPFTPEYSFCPARPLAALLATQRTARATHRACS